MTTLVVTGASGFLGSWIARTAAPHYDLKLLVRPSSDLTALTADDVPFERINADLSDPAAITRALQGADSLIHAAGHISFRRAQAARIREANLTLTETVLMAALAAGVRRVVYTASIFALGYAQGGLVTETSPCNAQEFLDIPYVNAKWQAEERAQQAISADLPLIRLYPGVCLGPGDVNQSSNKFIVGWRRGLLPALVRGGACFVDVRDSAEIHLLALEKGIVGRRYLAPGYNLTHAHFFAALAAIEKRLPPLLTVPGWMGVFYATLMERFLAQPPLHRDEARLMTRPWWYDDRASRAALGFDYRPLAVTLREMSA